MVKSAVSFHRRFRSEEACAEFLEEVRWNGEPVCPRCGCVRCYRIATRNCYKCSGCRRNFTVRHGTIFEDSKLSLLTWFSAVWHVTTARAGISSIELGEKVGISQKSAWFVLHRIQYVAAYGTFEKMSGHVEMDDTEMANRKNGHGATIVGIVQRGGSARFQKVESVDAYTVHNLANETIEKGAKLDTDGFRSYSRLGENFNHTRINHRDGYVIGENHTNTVEGAFGNFQRRLKGIHIHVSDKHLQRYCDAYAYRYNARELDPIERFENWFRGVVNRLTYKTLTA